MARTKEFDICLRTDVSDKAMRHLFTRGPLMAFRYEVPRGLISRIVEHFLQRPTKTALRPVYCICDCSTLGPTLLWQELYTDFFPSVSFQWRPVRDISFDDLMTEHMRYHDTVGWWLVATRGPLHHTATTLPSCQGSPTTYIIEVFRVENPVSGQAMTIELWFESCGFWGGLFPTNDRVKQDKLRYVMIYAGGCKNPVRIPLQRRVFKEIRAPTRRRRLLAELMLEVYRFLDRYSLDISQTVCEEWRDSVEGASARLALYALIVDFRHIDWVKRRTDGQLYDFMDREWEATFTNYSNCFGMVNSRVFHFLYSQPPAHSYTVIRRHLRNAFVKRITLTKTYTVPLVMWDFGWNVQVLVGLGESTLIEELDVFLMREECIALLGRFEEALIRSKVQKLNLWTTDPLMKPLIRDHSFFARPSIQQLRNLEIHIIHQDGPLEPCWLPALFELRGCRHFAVRYEPERQAHNTVDMTQVSSALRLMLENFEITDRDIAVDHFSLTCGYMDIASSLVGNRKPAYERVRVDHMPTASNIYYVETVDVKHCLTLFVPSDDRRTNGRTYVDIKRGKIADFT